MAYNTTVILKMIAQYLRDNPSLSLRDMARLLRVSPRTIQSVIGQLTGVDVRQLRRAMLLTKIDTLLRSEPTITVKELAFAVGYKSPRSFARAVRRAAGVSPKELRAKMDSAYSELLGGLATDGVIKDASGFLSRAHHINSLLRR